MKSYNTLQSWGTNPDFNEASINHLVYATISPIIIGSLNARLSEGEVVSIDRETGGMGNLLRWITFRWEREGLSS